MSSYGGLVSSPFCEIYCASKFAIEGFAEGLAPVMRNFNVKVNVVDPGAILSNFLQNGVSPVDPKLDDLTKELVDKVCKGFKVAFQKTGNLLK